MAFQTDYGKAIGSTNYRSSISVTIPYPIIFITIPGISVEISKESLSPTAKRLRHPVGYYLHFATIKPSRILAAEVVNAVKINLAKLYFGCFGFPLVFRVEHCR